MADALRPLVRNRLVLFGTGLILLVVLLALLANVVAPYDPTEMKVVDALKRPSAPHPFGTDRFGRDVLSRPRRRGPVSYTHLTLPTNSRV